MRIIYLLLFVSLTCGFSVNLFASPISNRIFKNLHEHISKGDHEKAIYYLRNHSRELVGVDKTLAKYAQGVLGVLRGDYAEAEKELDYAKSLKELHVYINYYKALSRFNQSKFSEAESFLKKTLDEKKIQRKLKEKINYLYGRVDLKNRRSKQAFKKLNPLLKRWRGSSKRADLLEVLLDASLNKKLFTKRRYCKWFKDLYVDHPTNIHSDEWGFKVSDMKFKGKKIDCDISLSKQRSKLRRYYLEGLNGDILKHLEQVKETDKYIYNKLLSSYYYYIGDFKKSLGVLAKDGKKNEDFNEEMRIARVSYYAGSPEKTLYIYKALYDKEKNKRKKARLLFELGNLNLQTSNYKESEVYFKKLLKEHPRTSYVRKIDWLLPWSMYLSGKYEESYKGFIELSDKIKKSPRRYRVDTKQTYYWAARSLQKAGQENIAAPIYKQLVGDPVVSYYSLLSALRLEDIAKKSQVLLTKDDFLKIPWKNEKDNVLAKKNRFLESFKLSSRMPSSVYVGTDSNGVPKVDLEASFPQKEEEEVTEIDASKYSEHLQRYTYLSRIGFWEEANEELALIKRLSKSKELKEKLIGYFEGTGDYKNMARLSSASFTKERYFGKPDEAFKFWSKSYPKAHEESVEGASKLFNVPKELVWGIMRAESFFDHKVLSPVGARGLLQVMPYTGSKLLSLLSGLDPLSAVVTKEKQAYISESLLKPEVNIRYGAKYLSRLQAQFKNHLPFVAASYNGGPHRVMMWSSMFGEVDQDEFTERVPFRETRGYIKKVMRNMFVYSSLYGQKTDMFYLIRPTAYVHKTVVPNAEYWGRL